MATINLGRVKGETGDTGPTGAAASITLGSVSTGAAGSSAAVTNTGTSGAAVFNFAIPRGDKGETGNTGPANSLSIAGVTTGAAGSSASVSIGGTSPSQTLTFEIPRGDQGIQGATGPQPSLVVADNANTAITLADADNNTVIRCTSSSAVTITIPSTLAAGFSCMVIQAGTGQITLAAGVGSTLNSFGSLVKTAGQHAPASIIRVASAIYNLSGNLV